MMKNDYPEKITDLFRGKPLEKNRDSLIDLGNQLGYKRWHSRGESEGWARSPGGLDRACPD